MRPSPVLRLTFLFFSVGGTLALLASLDCGPGRFEGIAGGARDSGDSLDRSADTGRVDDSASQNQCLQACANLHPQGLSADRAVESCIENSCTASCDTRDPARLAEEQDGAADAALGCTAEIDVFSTACNTCILAHCCTPWIACYGDAGSECDLLDECYEDCPE